MTLKGVMISTGKIITRAEKQLVWFHYLLIDHQTLFIIRLLYNDSTLYTGKLCTVQFHLMFKVIFIYLLAIFSNFGEIYKALKLFQTKYH